MKLQPMAERKRNHDALMRAGSLKKAAQLRHRVRALCSVHELALPKWAAASSTKGPRALPLDTHEKRHALLVAAGNRQAASKLRLDTRRRCIKSGEPVPTWAASQIAPTAQQEKRAPVRAAALLPATPLPFTPGKPLELPRPLREWCSASVARAVSVSLADGRVRLLYADAGEKYQADFESLEAAAAAVTPVIRWKRVEPANAARWAWTSRA